MASDSYTSPPSLYELESTFGVLFVGYVVSMVLYGFTFFQTYIYFSRYHKDAMWMKLMVAGLCALDTTNSALISQTLYYYLVSLFPSLSPLTKATSTFCAENGLLAVATAVVQLFFASRIFTLSRRCYPLSLLIVMSALASFAFGIAMTVHMFKNRAFSDLGLLHIRVTAATSMGLASLADVLIAASSMYYLRPSINPLMKPVTGWFDNLVTFIITRLTGATLIQFIYFLAFVSMPTKAIWMPFNVVMSKLYINSLLTLLNSREVHCGQGIHEEQTLSSQHVGKSTQSPFASTGQARSGAALRFNVMDNKPTINISVTQTIEHEGQKIEYDDDLSLNDRSNSKREEFTQSAETNEEHHCSFASLDGSERPLSPPGAVAI